MSLTAATALQQVRGMLQDGLSSDATPIPYNLVRLESLSDQLVTADDQTQFTIRFKDTPTQGAVSVYYIPGSLVAYVDYSGSPTTPTVDADVNGTFTLPVSPSSSVLVTYGWQYFLDSDIATFVDHARAWTREWSDVSLIPDGLEAAVISYATSEALAALARRVTLGDAKAGDASLNLSQIAKQYAALAAQMSKQAETLRASYWSRADEQLAPAADVASIAYDPYQPWR